MSNFQNKFCNKHNNNGLTLKKYRPGFTLIELIIVIAIIGILSTIVMVIFLKSQAKARDSERAADLRQIQTAVETYKEVNNRYPGQKKSIYSSYTGWKNSSNSSDLSFITDMKSYLDPLPREPKCGLFCNASNINMFYNYEHNPDNLAGSNDGYELDSGIETRVDLITGDGGYSQSTDTDAAGSVYAGRYELGNKLYILDCPLILSSDWHVFTGRTDIDTTARTYCQNLQPAG